MQLILYKHFDINMIQTLQETQKSQIRTILKDTIIFEQKDSLYIQSNELKELNANVSEIKHELNKKEDTFLGATYD